jgi:hypothetical protein
MLVRSHRSRHRGRGAENYWTPEAQTTSPACVCTVVAGVSFEIYTGAKHDAVGEAPGIARSSASKCRGEALLLERSGQTPGQAPA